MRTNRRRKLVNFPKAQAKIITIIVVPFVLLVAGIAVTLFLWLLGLEKTLLGAFPDQQRIISEILGSAWRSLLVMGGLGTLVGIPLFIAYGLKISHRIFGPLKGLELYLKDRRTKTVKTSLKVRSEDEMKAVIEEKAKIIMEIPSKKDPRFRQ